MAASDSTRVQVLLTAVDRMTAPFKKILAGSEGLSASLRSTSDALQQLNDQQRDISAYREQILLIRRSQAALDTQREKVRTLALQMRAMEKPSKAMNAEFEQSRRVAREMRITHTQQEAGLQRLRTQLNGSGISTLNLVSHERNLRTQIEKTSAAMKAKQQRLDRMKATEEGAKKIRDVGATAKGAGKRALQVEMKPVNAAIDHESMMADVGKSVDFEAPEQFKLMGRDIENLSMRLPIAQAEIVKIIATAGRANIPRQELVRFSEDAAKMGVVFNSTSQDAVQSMASWRSAFGMGQSEVVALADRINYLGNPANVGKISDIVTRISALGDVAGLKSGPLAALAATISDTGVDAAASATGIRNMMLALSSGESATASQLSAFEQLGINAQQMARHMQDDAGGAIVSVLKKLQALPQAQQDAMATDLFGSGSFQAIEPLLSKLQQLEANFGKVTNAGDYAGSMEAEYAARTATTASALQIAKNSVDVLSQSIGATLLPDVKALIEFTTNIINRVTEWVRANPQLTATLSKLAIGAAVLLVTFGQLLMMLGSAAMAFSHIHGVIGVLSNGKGLASLFTNITGLAGRAFPMLLNVGRGLMVMLGGISAPVLAIGAAVAVVAVLVWKYWEPIKAFMIGVWQGLQEAFAPVLEVLRAALAPLAPLWETISGAMAKAWAWVKQLFSPFQATSEQLEGATNAGRTFGKMLGYVMGGPLLLAISGIRLLARIFPAVLAVVKTVGSGVWQHLKGMWNLIAGLFTGNGGRMQQGLIQMWDGIKSVFSGWPSKLLELGASLITRLAEGLGLNIGAVIAALTGVFSGAWTYLKGVWDLIAGLFTGDGGRMRQGLTQMWEGIKAVFSGWPSKLLELGSSLIARLADGLGLNGEAVVATLTGIFGGAWTYLKGAWDLIAGLFTGDGDRMRQGLSKMWEGLNAYFSGWPAKLKQLGISLIVKLAEGLGLDTGAAIAALTGVFGGAWTYLKGVWDLIAGLFTGDGGRMRQGLTQMWEGIKAVFSDWPSKLLELGSSLIARLADGLGLNGEAVVATLTDIFGGAWTYLKGAWDLIAGLFTGDGDRMRQGLSKMWDGLDAMFSGWPSKLLELGSSLIARLAEGLGLNGEGVVGALTGVFGGAWTYLKGAWDLIAGLFTGDGDRMRQGLSKMWDGLDAMFSGWPSKLLELGSSLIARLAEGLGLNGEGVVGALSGVFGGAWTYLKGVWDMIAGLFTGDGDRIRQGLSKMWDGLDAMFSGWPSKLLELGVSLITRLTEGLGLNTGGIVAALTGVIGGAWTYLKGAWDLIAGLFTGNGERMRQGLIQMWDGMKAILDGWPTRLMQAGVDMITSLIDGIRSKIGAAVKVISDVGGGVVKSFKGWFDSPSSPRVPTQPRTKVPLVDPQSARPGSSGASRGLLFRNNKMASAGAGAAMALAAGTAPVAAFDGGTAVIAPAARAAPVAASSDNYVINVHPSAGMDEKALAREVGRQIEEISRRNAARQRSNLHD